MSSLTCGVVEAVCQPDLAGLLARTPPCGLSTWPLHVSSFGLPLSTMAEFQAHLKRGGQKCMTYLSIYLRNHIVSHQLHSLAGIPKICPGSRGKDIDSTCKDCQGHIVRRHEDIVTAILGKCNPLYLSFCNDLYNRLYLLSSFLFHSKKLECISLG